MKLDITEFTFAIKTAFENARNDEELESIQEMLVDTLGSLFQEKKMELE